MEFKKIWILLFNDYVYYMKILGKIKSWKILSSTKNKG